MAIHICVKSSTTFDRYKSSSVLWEISCLNWICEWIPRLNQLISWSIWDNLHAAGLMNGLQWISQVLQQLYALYQKPFQYILPCRKIADMQIWINILESLLRLVKTHTADILLVKKSLHEIAEWLISVMYISQKSNKEDVCDAPNSSLDLLNCAEQMIML